MDDMAEAWDAIIVGAGLGGLSSVARLAGKGLRVALVERSVHPGAPPTSATERA
ncbi:MAG: NAD(P)-binding protein [Actinomycetota bacterium]|nr:NAD(P)-binding protein [Actinomycetota bacterium]